MLDIINDGFILFCKVVHILNKFLTKIEEFIFNFISHIFKHILDYLFYILIFCIILALPILICVLNYGVLECLNEIYIKFGNEALLFIVFFIFVNLFFIYMEIRFCLIVYGEMCNSLLPLNIFNKMYKTMKKLNIEIEMPITKVNFDSDDIDNYWRQWRIFAKENKIENVASDKYSEKYSVLFNKCEYVYNNSIIYGKYDFKIYRVFKILTRDNKIYYAFTNVLKYSDIKEQK